MITKLKVDLVTTHEKWCLEVCIKTWFSYNTWKMIFRGVHGRIDERVSILEEFPSQGSTWCT